MTELAPRPTSRTVTVPRDPDDREHALNLAVYGLYLASPLTFGASALGGAVIAATRRKRAGRVSATHYRWQLWSFWAALGAAMAGGLWFGLGGLGSVGGTGGDLALAGIGLAILAGAGFMASSIYGLVRASSHAPMGEPDAA
jgi:uncharacterized membrane protein